MSPEAQRIAIAEACGWVQVTRDNKPEEIWEHKSSPYMCRVESKLPDYLNYLNAMNEAEKVLKDLDLYRKFLYLVVLQDASNGSNEPFEQPHPNAPKPSSELLTNGESRENNELLKE